MNERPKIKVHLSTADKVLEALGWTSLLVLWIWTLAHYGNLPQIIPIHYNAAGEADAFGDKGHIFVLPVVATVLFVGLSILNRYPQVFNYPQQITPENARQQYAHATRMIRFLKLSMVLIFGAVIVKTIQHAMLTSSNLGRWFLPATLLLLLGPIFYYLITMSSPNKNAIDQ